MVSFFLLCWRRKKCSARLPLLVGSSGVLILSCFTIQACQLCGNSCFIFISYHMKFFSSSLFTMYMLRYKGLNRLLMNKLVMLLCKFSVRNFFCLICIGRPLCGSIMLFTTTLLTRHILLLYYSWCQCRLLPFIVFLLYLSADHEYNSES
jgi:hypothetical protein